jgi:hypothetical protein
MSTAHRSDHPAFHLFFLFLHPYKSNMTRQSSQSTVQPQKNFPISRGLWPLPQWLRHQQTLKQQHQVSSMITGSSSQSC